MSPEPFYYRIVSEDKVSDPVLRAARRALEVSEARLGLRGVNLLWCLPARKYEYDMEEAEQQLAEGFDRMLRTFSVPRPRSVVRALQGEFLGITLPLVHKNTIIVRADTTPERVIAAVGHECQHVKDWRDEPETWGPYGDTEARARRFEVEIAAVLEI